VIELEDCNRVLLLSNVVGCPESALRVGLPVEIVWEDRSGGQSLYRFRPVEISTASREIRDRGGT
jgi:hypothetical protein